MSEQELIKLYRAFFVLGDVASLKILYELDRYGERNFSELKDNLSINPTTLSKKLKLLTEFGFIASDKTQDHLRVYYSIHNHKKQLKKILDAIERLSVAL